MMNIDPSSPNWPMLPPAFHLHLRGQLDEIREAQDWLGAIERQWDISESIGFALALCLEESLANIAMYAQVSGRDGCVVLQMDCTPGAFVLTIEDDGVPFDPTSVPRPPEYRSLAEAQTGQAGVHLIRNFAAAMDYRRLDGRNRLVLTFRHEGD